MTSQQRKRVWEKVYESYYINPVNGICYHLKKVLDLEYAYLMPEDIKSQLYDFDPCNTYFDGGFNWWNVITEEGRSNRLTAIAFLIAMNS